jgi:hypothetical protein
MLLMLSGRFRVMSTLSHPTDAGIGKGPHLLLQVPPDQRQDFARRNGCSAVGRSSYGLEPYGNLVNTAGRVETNIDGEGD